MKLTPEAQRLLAISGLLLWCAALIFFRLFLAEKSFSLSLLWNLFLACVPLGWSTLFRRAMARRRFIVAAIFFGLWLLFLPNAPYILTDLIHLSPRPSVPLWYLLAMLLSCAGTGTLLGYLSLIEVQNAVRQSFGGVIGWLVAGGSLMLCGFGIYVGRFLRWNSWDAFTHPFSLARSILHEMLHFDSQPHPLSVTSIYGVGLIFGYLGLRAVASAMATGAGMSSQAKKS